MRAGAALLLVLAACASAPTEPGETWRASTVRLAAEALPEGEFAVLAFEDPRATPGAGAALADALAAALRDRGRATLAREWAARNLPSAGVLSLRGRLLTWRQDAAEGWLVAEVAYTLAAGGEERLHGTLEYSLRLEPQPDATPEARLRALRAGLAAVLADELLKETG